MAITLRMKVLLLAAGLLGVFTVRGQDHLITQRNIRDCDGVFLDSGGPRGKYKNDERYTTTICPDTAQGSHVQLIFTRTDIAAGDSLCFYDGNSIRAPKLACEADFRYEGGFVIQATANNLSGCITVTFYSNPAGFLGLGGSVGDGWSADIKCAAPCQTILAELVTADPALNPADTGWIDVCPGERFSLTAKGTYPQNGTYYQHSDLNSSFTWDFQDGTKAVGPTVSHAYQKSGGYTVQVTIKDRRGCTSTNLISQRVRVSTKPTFAISDSLPTEICAGDTIGLKAVVNQIDKTYAVSAQSSESTFQAGATRSDSLALPDGTGRAYETAVRFTEFSPGQIVNSVNDIQSICVNMEHSWIRDLEISITCPNGQTATLHNFGGRAGSETYLGEPTDFDGATPKPGVGTDYCWVMGAKNGTWLEYVNDKTPKTLPAGDYEPFESLDSLVGCPLNGAWAIKVQDLWAIDNGYIFSWAINFDPSLFPNLEKFKNDIVTYGWQNNSSIFNFSQTSIDAAPQNGGTAVYVFKVTDDFGCNYDTTINVTVLPPTHPNCRDCDQIIAPQSDTSICNERSAGLNVNLPTLQKQTSVLFETTPAYTFGNATHGVSNPYNSALHVSGVFPLTVADATKQIDSVCIDIETNWLEDISVFLVSPSGKSMALTTKNGGAGLAYTRTCFSPAATTNITAGQSPFTGIFRPEGNWSDLNGSPVEGDWKLRVIDDEGLQDTGVVKSWSIVFRSTNAVQYNWTPSLGLSCTNCANPVAKPTVSTNYVVTARDNYNCVSTDTVVVSLGSGVKIDSVAATPVDCYSSNTGTASVFVSGGTGTYEYSWGDSLKQIASKAVFLKAGTYTVSITDGNECPATTTVTVRQPDSIAIAATVKDVLCVSDSNGTITATATGGVGNFSYAWNNTQTTNTATNLKAGSYILTVTDGNGCQFQKEIAVQEPQNPLSVNIAQIVNGCYGAKKNEARATPAGGTGTTFTYTWSNGQNNVNANNLDSLDYMVTVTDVNGCRATDTLKLVDLAPIQMNLIVSPPSCFNFKDGAMGVNIVSGGVGKTENDYNFRWSTGQIGTAIKDLSGGANYTVTVTDAQGCTGVSTRLLEQPEAVKFDLVAKNALCFGSLDGTASVVNTKGQGTNFTYRWDQPAKNQNTAAATNLGSGDYVVTVTDEKGCAGTATAKIGQPTRIETSFQTKNNICFGENKGEATVTPKGGTPGYTYTWANGSKVNKISELLAGSYQITVTDANGCIHTAAPQINQPTQLTAQLTTKDPNCDRGRDGSIAIAPTGGTSPYTFSLDNKNFNNISKLIALKADAYKVYVKDANGCTFVEKADITNPPRFTVSGGDNNYTIQLGDSVTLNATSVNGIGNVSYVWSAPYEGTLSCSECDSVSAKPMDMIIYELYAIDENGCEATDKVTVMVQKVREVAVPTGFTPNFDGMNDLLLVHGLPGTRITMLRIFDRWGELVYELENFEVNDKAQGWNGDFRGTPMSAGVYLWYLEVEYMDGMKESLKGQTTLIR